MIANKSLQLLRKGTPNVGVWRRLDEAIARSRRMERFLGETLSEGDHDLYFYTSGPPITVIIEDHELDDCGVRVFNVDVLSPDPDDYILLVDVVEFVERVHRRIPRRRQYRRPTLFLHIPDGAPPWVTTEDIIETIQVWQPYSKTALTAHDALEILVNVRQLLELLVRGDG